VSLIAVVYHNDNWLQKAYSLNKVY